MKYYLSVLTMLSNDARFLREFLEYYLLIGVEHFYLYDHRSSDYTDQILQPYIVNGLVTYTYVDEVIDGKNIDQFLTIHYTKGVEQARDETKWLAIVDSDEFIVPKKHSSLSKLLQSYEQYGGLAVNWQMFGTSGVLEIPAHKTMAQLLTRKAPLDYSMNQHVKVIVQPSKVRAIDKLHQATYYDDNYTVDSNRVMISGPFNSKVPIDLVQINHYFCRDLKFFQETKLPRRKAYGTPVEAVMRWEQEMNRVFDYSIQRFVPLLLKRLNLHLVPSCYHWKWYLLRYPDLSRNGVTTEEQALEHWLTFGIREHRDPSFPWKSYLQRNPDLRKKSPEEALKHWVDRGYNEKRKV